MNAWQIHSYGGLEELQLSKTARIPHVQDPNDIIVRVSASSINPIDMAMMAGYGSVLLNKARQVESCSLSETLEFPLVLGRDFCGQVVSKGHAVGSHVQVGDEVWGSLPPHQQGCHAQFVRVNKRLVEKKPENLSDVEAASIPYAGVTAWCALKVTGDIYWWSARGRRVLILGGSGGVGTAALQLLKAWGSCVVVTCRGDAAPLLEALGADCVIDYTSPDSQKLIREQGKYDIILDAAGLGADVGLSLIDCLKDWNLSKFITLRSPMLRNADEYGFVVGMMKNTVDILMSNIKTNLSSQTSTIRWAFYLPLPEAIKEITTLVEKGKMCPTIDKVYPFSQVPAAYERMKAGHLRGKVVVKMNEQDCSE
ncbi:hypothetical protein L9F63_022449 [Diploptera punctata]|uniref:Enoyl reductase (ER) domain-containing protein n=1 Tax=Diploptera punctata TaxID=6984 RepID=A0AAD7ZNC0_DIPPU|nr:hypothetical protein L9F63_022449 [Diploptera punctata]